MKRGSGNALDDLADVGSVHCSGRRGQHIICLVHSLYISILDAESYRYAVHDICPVQIK
jgi:hypothetical protein